MAVLDLIPKKKIRKPAAPVSRRIETPRYTPPTVPSPHPAPVFLVKKLRALGRRFCFVKTGAWFSRAAAIGIVLLGVQMFVDWLMDLSVLDRAVLLAADIAFFAFFFHRQLWPILRRPPGLEACALMVEKRWAHLKGRVIATIQFGSPGFAKDSSELIAALHEDTRKQTSFLDLREIVPLRPFLRYFLAALVAAAVWTSLFILFRPGSIALLERVFLLPAHVPRKTDVTCLSGDMTIPQGESVVLEAQARGIIPSHGRVTLKDDTGRIQEITIDPEKDHPDRFSLKIDSVEQPMTYTIRLNDGSSGDYSIRTVPRPYVVSIDCSQVYPAYTGLGTVKRSVDNLALLAGSKLQIHAVANAKIVRASIRLIGLDQERPVTIGSDGKDLTGEIDIPASGLTAFSIILTNQASITAGDKIQYRVDLIPDRAPTVQLTMPDRLEELFTIQGIATIGYTATDDYGLAKVTLCYRVLPTGDTEAVSDAGTPDTTTDATATPAGAATPAAAATPAGPPIQKIPLDLGPAKNPTELKGTYNWDLAAMKPPLVEGTTIEYWIEAQDGNNVTGPGISDSEHHTLKIVSEMEKRADVMNRLLDKLTNLKDISDDQNKINHNLQQTLEGKPAQQK